MREGRAKEIEMNQRGYDEQEYPRYLWRLLEVLRHAVHPFVKKFSSPDVQQARDGIGTKKGAAKEQPRSNDPEGDVNRLRRPNPILGLQYRESKLEN